MVLTLPLANFIVNNLKYFIIIGFPVSSFIFVRKMIVTPVGWEEWKPLDWAQSLCGLWVPPLLGGFIMWYCLIFDLLIWLMSCA